eukprot:GHVT01018816.1.p1 GENE.GHVT01018816.1~~GHVT01018816.1.p1  ORF type:complete len:190 (-),score=18.52 GHVT01018816.1:1580-2149(-)
MTALDNITTKLHTWLDASFECLQAGLNNQAEWQRKLMAESNGKFRTDNAPEPSENQFAESIIECNDRTEPTTVPHDSQNNSPSMIFIKDDMEECIDQSQLNVAFYDAKDSNTSLAHDVASNAEKCIDQSEQAHAALDSKDSYNALEQFAEIKEEECTNPSAPTNAFHKLLHCSTPETLSYDDSFHTNGS